MKTGTVFRPASFLGAALAGVVAVTAAWPVSAGPLVPHRALYAMRLKSTSISGPLSDIRGAMSFEIQDRCQGWEINSKVYLRLDYQGRDEVESMRSYHTWESKDGLDYRFKVHESQPGESDSNIEGVAILDGRGQAGVAEYTKPKALRVNLPAGTVFPTAHAALLVAQAEQGKHFVGKVVFDGSSLDNPFEISAVIGKQLKTTAGSAERLHLDRVREWSTEMAYFPLLSKAETPDFQLDVRLREDGIVSKLIQDFGDYSIEADLDHIEILPPAPNC